ncbi:MAG: cell division protein ZapB [Treponema sp.]|jgi:chromosome segregation ATPase|nr:cell division protein ZapB [Treponema sp.]
MVSLEQVKLLETKVARAIEYVERVTGEKALLQEKLESYEKRIDELEVLVQRFKEDQGRIEDGILSALDRLNQFEDVIEKSLAARKKPEEADKKPAPGPETGIPPSPPPPETGDDPDTLDTGIDVPEPEDAGEDEENSNPPPENGELDIF